MDDPHPLLHILTYRTRQVMDAVGPSDTALGARDAVQQRSTATVEPESEPDGRYQASDQRVRLHQTLPPTIVVQDVAGSSHFTYPRSGGFQREPNGGTGCYVSGPHISCHNP